LWGDLLSPPHSEILVWDGLAYKVTLYVIIIDLPSGHMTGAISTPFVDFIDSNSKTIKSPEKIKEGTVY